MTLDHDIFNWVWQVDNTFFLPVIHKGNLGYRLTNKDGVIISDFTFWRDVKNISTENAYQKVKSYVNPDIYGPHQPPVSPVIKKIREMAKRRETNPNTLNVPVW